MTERKKSFTAVENGVVPWTTRAFGASPEGGPATPRLTLGTTAVSAVATPFHRKKKKKKSKNVDSPPPPPHPPSTATMAVKTPASASGGGGGGGSENWLASFFGWISQHPDATPGLGVICGLIQSNNSFKQTNSLFSSSIPSSSSCTEEENKKKKELTITTVTFTKSVSSIGAGWSHGQTAAATAVGLSTDTPIPLPSSSSSSPYRPQKGGGEEDDQKYVKVPFGATLDSVHPEFLEGRTGGMLYLVLRVSGAEGDGLDDEPCSYAPIAVPKGTRLRFQPPSTTVTTSNDTTPLSQTASFRIRSACREDACVMARLIERRSNQEGFSEKWQQVASGFIPLKEWLESICTLGNKSASFVITLHETGRVAPRPGDNDKLKTFTQTFACVRVQMTGRKDRKSVV